MIVGRAALALMTILLCSVLVCAQTAAPAPAVSPDALMDVLQVLQTKGVITQTEYDSLKQRVTAQQAVAVAPAPAAAATPEEKAAFVRKAPSGVGMIIGDYTVTFSGEVNGFYVHERSSKTGAAPVLGLASVGSVPNSSVRNGLLPENFSFNVATRQAGWDLGVTFGMYPGLNSLHVTPGGVNLSPGQPTGFGVSGIDFRQQFVTIGRKDLGTFKVGRDIGFFGQEAILNDMTLLGAGTTNGNVAPGQVTLGRIGLGYIYGDFQPQISYMTPSMHGVQLGFAVMQPLSDALGGGAAPISASLNGHGQPQFQAKLTYGSPAGKKTNFKIWTNMITQSMEANIGDAIVPAIPVGKDVRVWGVDGGGKVGFGGAELLAYGYKGWGIGTEGLMFFGITPSGRQRESDGFYVQGTYTFAKKFMLGASYGLSHLDLAGPTDLATGLVRENRSWVGQSRYKLTSWVNLIGEYTHNRAVSHVPGSPRVTSDSIAVGPIVFF